MHTVLGILVDTLPLYFGNGWSVSNILENGRRLGHIIGKRLIIMHLYTTPHRSRYIVNVYTLLVISLGHDLSAPPFQKCIQVEKPGGTGVGAKVRSLQAPRSLHSPAHRFCILPKLTVRLNICRYLAASAENIWTFLHISSQPLRPLTVSASLGMRTLLVLLSSLLACSVGGYAVQKR